MAARFEDMNKLAEKLTRGGSPEATKIKQDNHELQASLKKLDEDWQVKNVKRQDMIWHNMTGDDLTGHKTRHDPRYKT